MAYFHLLLATVRQHAQGSLQQVLEGDSTLLKRLKLDSVKDRDLKPLPVEFLRKYIAYARQYVNPRYILVYGLAKLTFTHVE